MMRLEVTRDFGVSAETVIAQFADRERLQQVLRGMGVTVQAGTHDGPLQASLRWRGVARRFTVTPPLVAGNTVSVRVAAVPASAVVTVRVTDRPGGSSVHAVTDIMAHTAKATLAVQSLRLVRGKAQKRLSGLIAALVG